MEKIITISIPFFLGFLALELFLSRKWEKNFFYTKDTLGDLGTGILNQLVAFFTKAWPVMIYHWAYQYVSIAGTPGLWTPEFSSFHGILSWVIGFVLVDLVYYFFHRHSHEVNLMWATHIVHHSSEEYNLAVALRQSSFSFIFNMLYGLILAVIGLPPEIFFSCYALNLVYQFWIHTRFIKTLGWFELVFNTPSHHRVHHARQEKYLDCNYAGVLIIWDKLFGTFRKEEEEPHYGVYPRFQSYDPVRANIYPLLELKNYFWWSKGSDRLKVLFSGPLWIYTKFKRGSQGGIRDNGREVDTLSLVHFFIGLLAALTVLFVPAMPKLWQVIFALISLLNLKLMGVRLDRKISN